MFGVTGGEEAPWGAYVPDLDRFDAGFFRIAPVEAELMDPQQRLLLEVSWEALEDAGLDPWGLKGSRSGVYAGISTNDYRELVGESVGDPARSLYTATGASPAAAIGRVAFALGLTGPALAVDTACSASLVAIHQAIGRPPAGRGGPGAGGGCERDPDRGGDTGVRGGGDAVAGRAVQDVRRAGGRVCAGRGVRDAGAEAAFGRGA